MRLAGRTWRTLISEVRMGRDRYRVISPERPPRHAPLHEGRLGAQLSIDRDAAVDLAIAWWLAARSPRSLLYLPLRESEAVCGEQYGRRLDLVLLHHSLGFAPSKWKQVRARRSSPKAHTVTMPPRALGAFAVEDHRRRSHRDFRDHLDWTIAADTLFIIGSRRAFELEGDQMRGLAEDCPAHLVELPESHCCAEIELGRGNRSSPDRRNPHAQLHIEYCNHHW